MLRIQGIVSQVADSHAVQRDTSAGQNGFEPVEVSHHVPRFPLSVGEDRRVRLR
jgi:hypothetical protein